MWKSFETEQPDQGQLVIVYDGDVCKITKELGNRWCCADDISGAIYRDGKFWYPSFDDEFELEGVTLWMDAPNPSV